MRVLTVSDKIVEWIYSPAIREYARGVELVLSAGDLPAHYLEYIVSMLDVPLFYVMGNHGGEGGEGVYPEGCENLDGRAVEYKGLLLAGLEGAPRYNTKPAFQYTENQMRTKIAALAPALILNRARRGRYLDVLLTHAPPAGIHDERDYAHRGFQSFLWLIDHWQPRYHIHGHKHVYDNREPIETRRGETIVINTYGSKILDIPILK